MAEWWAAAWLQKWLLSIRTCCSWRWSTPRSIAPPRSRLHTLDGFLGWSFFAVLFVMLAVAFRSGVHRRGGSLAVVRLHGSLVLDIFADVGFSMLVLTFVG